jgi:hypothetical protein
MRWEIVVLHAFTCKKMMDFYPGKWWFLPWVLPDKNGGATRILTPTWALK